jgi:hypothetical protein
LLDEKALAACMAYVDLNPVRAGLSKTPEQSEYTSIEERVRRDKPHAGQSDTANTPSGLLPFVGYPREAMPKGLPFRLNDYLELIDWTGRAIPENKRGHIPDDQPPILERLQIEPKHWLYMTQNFESRFKGLVGMSTRLVAACQRLEYRRMQNLAAVRLLLT